MSSVIVASSEHTIGNVFSGRLPTETVTFVPYNGTCAIGELLTRAAKRLATPHMAGLSVASWNTLRVAMELLK